MDKRSSNQVNQKNQGSDNWAMNFKIDSTYKIWLKELKSKVRSAQIKAALAVNTELIQLYWELGRMIEEKESIWGDKLISQLAIDLKDEFPDLSGFSRSNLYYCKKFYSFYQEETVQQVVGLMGNATDDSVQQLDGQLENNDKKDEHQMNQQAVDQSQEANNKQITIRQQAVAQIPWGHNILIFTKCKSVEIALFYVQQTIENQWSRIVLKEQLKSELHLRKGKAISNFTQTLPNAYSVLVRETLKDPYIFDFLQLDTEYRERDVENQLVRHINRFLLELGKGFAFVGQQYSLVVSDTEYFLDLLFYHTRLKCYVVVELKNTEFRPEYTGKLNFYLSAVDSLVKMEDDNPTIGLLLCREKDSIAAEFALRDIQKPIGISEYLLTKELPENLKSSLPTIEEIENQLNFGEDGEK